jgi:hypothetical protein
VVSPAGAFPLIYSTSLAANAHVQSKSGRPAGEIRVILQFTPSGAQPGMPTVMPGSVRPPTYGAPAPYGAAPYGGQSVSHDFAAFVCLAWD